MDPVLWWRTPGAGTGRRVAGELACELVGALDGTDPAALTLVRCCPACGSDEHGRPAVVGSKRLVSLARAPQVVVVAAAATSVGVDVEPVVSPAAIADLAKTLHPQEIREVEDADDPAVVLTRIWTRKEALLKALGTGLARDPSLDYVGEGRPDLRPSGWRFWDLDLLADHCAALCVCEPAGEVQVLRVG